VRFNWNEVKFSVFATYELLINITGWFSRRNKRVSIIYFIRRRDTPTITDPALFVLGLLFAVFVLSKRFRVADEIIGALSTLSQTLAALYYYAFAYNEFLFYAGESAGRGRPKPSNTYGPVVLQDHW